jgi:hypothetical protein
VVRIIAVGVIAGPGDHELNLRDCGRERSEDAGKPKEDAVDAVKEDKGGVIIFIPRDEIQAMNSKGEGNNCVRKDYSEDRRVGG